MAVEIQYAALVASAGEGLKTAAIILGLIFGFVLPAVAVLWFARFNIKCKYKKLYGDGKGGFKLSDKEYNTAFCYSDKTKTQWSCRADNLGFSKRTHKPFDARYIYGGNKVYAVQLPTGEFVPSEWVIQQGEQKQVVASLNVVPQHLRAWQSLEHQKITSEWRDTKRETQAMVMFIVACVAGVAIAAGSMYFAYKFGSPSLATIQQNTDAINNLAQAMAGKVTPIAPR